MSHSRPAYALRPAALLVATALSGNQAVAFSPFADIPLHLQTTNTVVGGGKA